MLLPDEMIINIAHCSNLASIVTLSHVCVDLNSLLTKYFCGIGYDNVYEDALVTGHEYISKLFYFVLEIRRKYCDNFRPPTNLYKKLVQSGNLDLIKWFHSKNNLFSREHDIDLLLRQAALHNQKSFIEWCMAETGVVMSAQVAYGAATGGHLSLLKWYRNAGFDFNEILISGNAAEGGHFPQPGKILDWVQMNPM